MKKLVEAKFSYDCGPTLLNFRLDASAAYLQKI